MIRRFVRTIAVLAALALLATACGGDSTSTPDDTAPPDTADPTAADEGGADGDADPGDTGDTPAAEDGADGDGDTTASDEAPLTATWRGVTPDTIRVGIAMLDFEFLVQNNLSPQGWGDQQLVWQTFIDELNDRGGILGRRIEPVFTFYNPIGTAEAEAACLTMTEDNETFAVLAGFVGPAEPANTCITGAHDTVLVGGRASSERRAQSTAPWIETQATRERRLDILVSLLDQTGRLEGRRIAVVGTQAAQVEYDKAEDVLTSHGAEVVLTAFNDATVGDIPAEDAVWGPLTQRIDASGADVVFALGGINSAIRNLRNAGSTVEIWSLDHDALRNLGDTVSPDQAAGVVTAAGLTDQEAWEHETSARCREIFAAAHPDIEVTDPVDTPRGTERWFTPIMGYCRYLQTFEMIATAAGPELTPETFLAAAESLGSFELPAQPFSSLGPGKYDANDTFRLVEFDPDAGENGDLSPLTDIIDATP